MTIDLWVEASRDYDREDTDLRLSRAKIATASLWPFLSLAKTAGEFEQRLDLAQEIIASRVEAAMVDPVNDSFREDFGIATTGTLKVVASQHPEEITPWHVHQGAQQGDLWESLHEPVAKTATAPTTPKIPPQPTRPRPAVSAPRQMQIYSLATKSWITIESNADGDPDSRGNPVGNPYYFDGGLEEGPHTDETGMYPVAPDGPDPISPLQSEYPMQPTAWTSKPDGAWVERPMQFGTKSAANENYFSGGTEGVEGDQSGTFPEDVSLPEEDERVDFYGGVPPVHGSIQAEADYHYIHPDPDGNGFVITQKDTGKVLSHHDTREKAEAAFRAMMWSKHSGSKMLPDFRSGSGTSFRVLADLGDNPYSGTDNTAMDSPVQPPPTMMEGGPGAEAQPTDTGTTSASDQAAKTSHLHLADGQVRERPSAENPSGVADEFDSNTWEGFNNQRPRQNAELRGINTPQRPKEPIHQNTSSGMAEGEEDEDEDEGNEREAALHVAAWAAFQALEGIAA